MNTNLRSGYFEHKIDACFVTRPMFFLFYMPIFMGRYNKLKEYFVKNEFEIDWKIGMIEKAKFIGNGYIGLAHTSGDRLINETFIAYKMVGDYSQFKKMYHKIKMDYPTACDFYNVYMTDPNVTRSELNVTFILFKIN